MDDSEEFFVFRVMGDRRPRVLDAVRSDFSASLDFLPFFPPKRPPKIPFFFFLVSLFSEGCAAIVGRDFTEAEAVDAAGGSSTS
jgi:hypothetical protein